MQAVSSERCHTILQSNLTSVLSFDYFRTVKEWVTQWDELGTSEFCAAEKGTDINTFNKKVEDIVTVNTGDTTRKAVAMKFSEGYLHNHYDNDNEAGERIEYVNLFTVLAAFILVIACINFTNLSTAKAARRLKEVGIKKAIGARRNQLMNSVSRGIIPAHYCLL